VILLYGILLFLLRVSSIDLDSHSVLRIFYFCSKTVVVDKDAEAKKAEAKRDAKAAQKAAREMQKAGADAAAASLKANSADE
jgi:hypothetical protein